jgi:hypothetical protein
MKNKHIFLVGIILLLSMTSCLKSLLCVRGDGIIEVETHRVTSFNQIENSTSFDIIYRKADTLGISIRAEQNILDYIETNVYDNCLEIRTSPGSICLDYTEKPVITVTSPSLKKIINSGSGAFLANTLSGENIALKLSGSGDISVQNATGNSIGIILSGSGNIKIEEAFCSISDLLISGSGDIYISGESENGHLKITGSGKIYSYDFITSSNSVIISGSGNVYTTVEDYLNALISGSGNIYVRGDPKIDQTVTGSGRIIKTK